MTTYDKQNDHYVVPVVYSGLSYITVQGVDDAVGARHAAMKAAEKNLASAMEGLDISVGSWPMQSECIVQETRLEDIDCE